MNQNQTESKPLSVEKPADEGLDETTCSLSSIREAMLYAACDSEEGIILTPMNGTEIVLNDAEAKQLGEWLLHITSQDSRLRRSVDSSVTAACPSDEPNGTIWSYAATVERERDEAIKAIKSAKAYKRVLKNENDRLRRMLNLPENANVDARIPAPSKPESITD